MGTDSVGKVEVLTGTPCVATEVAGVANSTPPKKAFHRCAHGDRKLLGSRTIYRKRLGLILEDKKKREGDMKIKVTFFFFLGE